MNNTTASTLSTYKHHAVIPPPAFDENEVKHRLVVVDSKDRNAGLFPLPSRYDVELLDDIDDVKYVQLIRADVPLSMPMINSYFDTLYVSINSTLFAVQIDHGTYTGSQLAEAMQTRLRATTTSNDFTVTYSSITNKFTFTFTAAFALWFTQQSERNNLAPLLGFVQGQSYTSDATAHSITAPYAWNPAYNNYTVLSIDQLDAIYGTNTTTHNAHVILSSRESDLNLTIHQNVPKKLTPALNKVTKLRVSFFDRYGNPYDFQNMNHRLEFLFYYYKHGRKYKAAP